MVTDCLMQEWSKFWAENKKELDKTAKRFMAIDKVNHVKLTVTNAPSVEDNSFLTTDFLPKDPSYGKRIVRIAKDVLLESVDVEGITVGEEIVLVRWGKYRHSANGSYPTRYLPDHSLQV
jgi:glutamyl-tRNA synthetase